MVTRTALSGIAGLTSLALVGQGGAITPLEWGVGPLTVSALPRIVHTAHRGGAREVPENSMSGLMAAYERGTAQVLDLDTRMLRDGTMVVMHDATLNRTTFMGGPVDALDRRDWEGVRLRPGDGLPGSWRSERPPTLAEVLDRFGGRVVLMLEAKDPRSLSALAAMIRSRGLTRSVLVNSNHPAVAWRAHRMGLVSQLWRSARQMRTDRPERWRSFVDVLDVDHKARDRDLVRAVRSGIPRVWAHTVVTPAQRDRALALGCDGIITDAPGRLARAAGRRAGGRQAGSQRGARP
ncbi:glycerophosphodiester phosphodiesterase [Streptomyces sp. IB201691-2A2]|uniref:glycerophosphodiester phosphodiesterase n=1 Tax=Streptomyces sp. IB201691-2A2 TaxID=2561920 RepID=UPI00117D0218|nr:glycerophosphodiester phosphodiesterase [Streptomyces sp. IB201691-2A2]TRO69215.1 glycerophosphodiester phosphodiesterase [Streptomyces sp. IB201691-2A2]